jgi:hypothetical protein
MLKAAIPLGLEVFLGIRRRAPRISNIHASLSGEAERLGALVSELTYQFKAASKKYDAEIVQRQMPQARLADAAVYIHAWACTLSRLDADIRAGRNGTEMARDRAAAEHFFDLAELEIRQRFREIHEHADDSMLRAADAALAHSATLPNDLFIIPERSPTAKGTGRTPTQSHIKQFPGTGRGVAGGTGRENMQTTIDQLH